MPSEVLDRRSWGRMLSAFDGRAVTTRTIKEVLLDGASALLYYLGLVKLLNRFVRSFGGTRLRVGGLAVPFINRKRAGNVQILAYHRVNDEQDPFSPGTPIKVFAQQMEYLAKNFRLCSLEEAVDHLVKRDVPKNTIVVTFDDGYKDNYLHAFPVMRLFSIPATIFLATDSIGSGKVLWHDRVFSAFRNTLKDVLLWDGGSPQTFSLKSVDDKLHAQGHVLRCLRLLDETERSKQIEHLLDKLEVDDQTYDPTLMLEWRDAKEMQQRGIGIGSHTASHPILSKLSPDQVKEQIQRSTQAIQQHLGTSPKTFAYPNGRQEDFGEPAKAILREAGYTCAVSTIFGVNECDQDLFELKRGRPWEHFLPTYALKLNWYRLVS